MGSRAPNIPNAPVDPSASERLDSWKEIAAYLKRDERTLRRWEKSEGLPVHRHAHNRLASVYAYRAELDAWWNNGRNRLQQQEQRPGPSIGARLRPALTVAAFTLIVASLGYFAWHSAQPAVHPPPGRIMLAVLPFSNYTGDPQQEHLSDGFTDEMITQLARLQPQQLGVLARTSTMKYKASNKGVDQVGRELHADYVLEGSVHRAGDRLRITAQLIQVSDQTHLWAESYDRDLRDLLGLQRDVALTIARQIKLAVAPAAAGPRFHPTNPVAYDAYLRGRYHQFQATIPGLMKAIESYEQAIAKEPGYALAHAGLARAYIFGTRLEPKIALARAREAARKAIELDPTLPEAQLALAMTNLYADWDWASAEKEFERAIQMDPGNAEAHFYRSHYLAAVGRFDEAIASARHAQQLDPFSPLIAHYVGRHLYFARRYDEALSEYRKALELDPNYPWTHVFAYVAYERNNDLAKAVSHRQRYWGLLGNPPEQVTRLGDLHSKLGYPAVLRQWAEWLEKSARDRGFVTSTELVLLYTALDQKDPAFNWLEKAIDAHTRDLIYLNVDPGFDPLRGDSRFAALLKRVGLTPPATRM